MRKTLPVEDLARDERFVRVPLTERINDPRSIKNTAMRSQAKLTPKRPDASDAARNLMHGIFVGEIQALGGAGRPCGDFKPGEGRDEAPFPLKLDRAGQCGDEARHCEISV